MQLCRLEAISLQLSALSLQLSADRGKPFAIHFPESKTKRASSRRFPARRSYMLMLKNKGNSSPDTARMQTQETSAPENSRLPQTSKSHSASPPIRSLAGPAGAMEVSRSGNSGSMPSRSEFQAIRRQEPELGKARQWQAIWRLTAFARRFAPSNAVRLHMAGGFLSPVPFRVLSGQRKMGGIPMDSHS